jgi:hypothetical protein
MVKAMRGTKSKKGDVCSAGLRTLDFNSCFGWRNAKNTQDATPFMFPCGRVNDGRRVNERVSGYRRDSRRVNNCRRVKDSRWLNGRLNEGL